MPRVESLLTTKSSQERSPVVSVSPSASVFDAAQLMNEHHIGAVVVTDADGGLLGIFTERDIMTRVVAARRDPDGTPIGEVMTESVSVCDRATPVDELRALMRERHIRHVPVVEDGRVIGMVSIGDLNVAEVKVMTETISYLEQFMYKG